MSELKLTSTARVRVPIDPDRAPAWTDQAACVGADPELWFPDRGRAGYDAARAICDTCPVKALCLKDAMSTENTNTRFGMRGGLTPEERATVYSRNKPSRLARTAARKDVT